MKGSGTWQAVSEIVIVMIIATNIGRDFVWQIYIAILLSGYLRLAPFVMDKKNAMLHFPLFVWIMLWAPAFTP